MLLVSQRSKEPNRTTYRQHKVGRSGWDRIYNALFSLLLSQPFSPTNYECNELMSDHFLQTIMAATTTTVTFGLLAGGGLAAAAAVAGALGLGLAALALKSRRHRKVHHVHHGGGHSGYGGGHGSYGDHGGGYGHRRADKATRKRRAIDSTNANENENEDDNDWKKEKEREEILMEVRYVALNR